MAPPIPNEEDLEHTDRVLLFMGRALDEASNICEEFFPKEDDGADAGAKAPSVEAPVRVKPRITTVTAGHPANIEHEDIRQRLFSGEANILNGMKSHFGAKIDDPATPQPKPGLRGDNIHQSIQQGPELTTEDYALISKGFQDRLRLNVARFACANGIMGADWAVITGGVDEHSAEIMQDFYVEYGLPNPAETIMLAGLLGYTTHVVTAFCNRVQANAADTRRAEDLVANKVLLLKLQEVGILEEIQDMTRAHAEDLPIEDMD